LVINNKRTRRLPWPNNCSLCDSFTQQI